MTEPDDRPKWRTNVLWAILAVFLVLGSIGIATFVYGLIWFFGGAWYGVMVAGVGVIVAFLAFLFMAGILYRVDRYRGANGRRIELFE